MEEKFTALLKEKQKKKRIADLWDMQKLQKIVEWYRSRALRKQQWAEVGTALSLQAEFFCRRVDCVFRQAEKMRDSLYSTDRKRGQEEIDPDQAKLLSQKRRMRKSAKGTLYVGASLQVNPHRPVRENNRASMARCVPFASSYGGTVNYEQYDKRIEHLKARSLFGGGGQNENEVEINGKRLRLEEVLEMENVRPKKKRFLSQRKQRLTELLIPSKLLDMMQAIIDGKDYVQKKKKAEELPILGSFSPIEPIDPLSLSPLDDDNGEVAAMLSPGPFSDGDFDEMPGLMNDTQSPITQSQALSFLAEESQKEPEFKPHSEEIHPRPKPIGRTTSFGRAIVRKQWRHGVFELEPRKWPEAKIFRRWNKPSDRPGKPQPKRRKKKTKTRNTTFGKGKIVEVEDGVWKIKIKKLGWVYRPWNLKRPKQKVEVKIEEAVSSSAVLEKASDGFPELDSLLGDPDDRSDVGDFFAPDPMEPQHSTSESESEDDYEQLLTIQTDLATSNITELTRIIRECLPQKVGEEPMAFADVVNYVRHRKDDETLSVGVIFFALLVLVNLNGVDESKLGLEREDFLDTEQDFFIRRNANGELVINPESVSIASAPYMPAVSMNAAMQID